MLSLSVIVLDCPWLSVLFVISIVVDAFMHRNLHALVEAMWSLPLRSLTAWEGLGSESRWRQRICFVWDMMLHGM